MKTYLRRVEVSVLYVCGFFSVWYMLVSIVNFKTNKGPYVKMISTINFTELFDLCSKFDQL